MKYCTAICVVVAAAIGLHAVAQDCPQQGIEDQLFPAAINNCGVNSLYVLLGLHGFEINHDQYLERISAGRMGSSMSELKRAAETFGAELRVYRSPDGRITKSANTPMLVLMHGSDRHLFESGSIGHFLVLLGFRRSTNELVLLDARYGTTFSRDARSFEKEWTGYMLAFPKTPVSDARRVLVITLAMLVAFFLISRLRIFRTYYIVTTFAYFIVVSAVSVEAAEPTVRTPGMDGINATFVLLRLNNRSIDHSTLYSMLGHRDNSVTLGSIKEVIERSGTSCKIVRCTPEQLKSVESPCIIFLESSIAGKGELCILLDYVESRRRWLLLRAGVLQFKGMTDEVFARHWSGYALITVDSHRAYARWFSLFLIGMTSIRFCIAIVKTIRGPRLCNQLA